MTPALPERDTFLAQYGFSAEQFERAGLEWKDLISIHTAHARETPQLQANGDTYPSGYANWRPYTR